MRILFLLSIQRIFESDAQQHTHILHLRAIIWCSCELSSGDFKGRPSIRHDEPLLHATTAYEMNEKFKQCINYPNECIRFSLHGVMLFQLVFDEISLQYDRLLRHLEQIFCNYGYSEFIDFNVMH